MEKQSLLWALVRINLFGVGLIVIVIFIVKSKSLFKPMRKDLSPSTVKKYRIVTKGIIILAIALVFFYTTIPVLTDTFWVLKTKPSLKEIPVKEGKIINRNTFFGQFWIKQDIYFEDNKSTPYRMYFMGTPVIEGRRYRIRYLPKSRAVVKITRIRE